MKSKNVELVTAMARVAITGKALAARVPCHWTTVSGLVNNRRVPTVEHAHRIAAILGAPTEKLFPEVAS